MCIEGKSLSSFLKRRGEALFTFGLDLADSGFDATVLCEFRSRLVQGDAAQLLLDTLLDLFKQQG